MTFARLYVLNMALAFVALVMAGRQIPARERRAGAVVVLTVLWPLLLVILGFTLARRVVSALLVWGKEKEGE